LAAARHEEREGNGKHRVGEAFEATESPDGAVISLHHAVMSGSALAQRQLGEERTGAMTMVNSSGSEMKRDVAGATLMTALSVRRSPLGQRGSPMDATAAPAVEGLNLERSVSG
jgi:hypothetical protein